MRKTETVRDYLERLGKDYSDAGQFNVYKVDRHYKGVSSPPCRRDFYKICLILNTEGVISYADKVIHVKDNAIFFGNPMIPYAWEGLSERQEGYFCMFTEEFVNKQLNADSLSESPLFRINGNAVLFPEQQSMDFLIGIFEQMLKELASPYKNKYELLRSYVQILMHEALKIEPPEIAHTVSSSNRISDLFLELLGRQFPVTSPQHVIQLKNAGEFAHQLSIHTNHLNRSLKEVTGKTTSEHITERMIKEAKTLLLHSNWDIAEIGYCLGFEHPSNFNIFFKKQTGQTPNHFRRQIVVRS
ncbi:Helix-turn-helix domain-containing protein [Chitinophaga sp. YR573]|uniref:helix-turn-helix domain-containing protein n=1 Tax=Chitinophaga sp. YR573 TaxID=1881040 RepID=UPI0008BBF824|nr:helix-turn-helix domain-containing protein [Chitinophaga sp. YR573]SEW07050.1 Helix-turn-helix domain-containing protein [Chitinophaga sp. YR573]